MNSEVDLDPSTLAGKLNSDSNKGATIEIKKGGGTSQFDPEGSGSNSNNCNNGGLASCILGSLGATGGCYDGNDQSNWMKMQEADTSGCGGGSGGGNAMAYFKAAGWEFTDPVPTDLNNLQSAIDQYGADSLEAANFAAKVLNYFFLNFLFLSSISLVSLKK